MSKIQEIKQQTIKAFQLNDTDTGSTAVQVALLTQRINHLNEHFKTAKKDFASRTGLMKLVGTRRRLLDYLKKEDQKKYEDVIARLGIRK